MFYALPIKNSRAIQRRPLSICQGSPFFFYQFNQFKPQAPLLSISLQVLGVANVAYLLRYPLTKYVQYYPRVIVLTTMLTRKTEGLWRFMGRGVNCLLGVTGRIFLQNVLVIKRRNSSSELPSVQGQLIFRFV